MRQPIVAHISYNTEQLQRMSKTLATQELHDVMFKLEQCKNPCAELLFSMAEQGLVYPLNQTELQELRGKDTTLFPPNEWDSPMLLGDEIRPLNFCPTKDQIRDILKQDIGGENFFRFVPSRGSPEKDANAIAKLLNNIGDPIYCEPGSIIHMKSPTFDQLHSKSMNWKSDGFLGQSAFQMTVAPANQVFDLGHYEHCFVSTLITGTKIWLAYPPLHGNLDVMRKVYKEMFIKQSSQIPTSTLLTMQHGIAIIQKQGQSLIIPPFWSILAICTESSTSSGFFVATALNFVKRIRNVDVFLAMNRLWNTKEQEQEHLITYATEFATHFSLILKNRLEGFQTDSIFIELCRAWTGDVKAATKAKSKKNVHTETETQIWALEKQNDNSETTRTVESSMIMKSLMARIAYLCESIQNPKKRVHIEQIFQRAWIDFLQEKSKKKPECRLCHKRIEHMQGGETKAQRLEQHFYDFHWGP